ncbi:hypothetical protein C4573_02200 [Candidatus Woesearchaeota archaeon]|nr:MAG: hypothetical protein C4573_02200 [Candidatus Woesearchaeota archaeon]
MKNTLPEGWKEVELGDIFNFQKKSNIKAGDNQKEGKYKFFTSSDIQSKFIDNAVFDGEYLIFSTGGSAGVHYCNEKFSTSTDCFVVKVDNRLIAKYVYYYLFTNIHILEAGFKGAGLRHISKEYIKRIKIVFPEKKETQQKIVSILEKAEKAKEMRKEADELTKYFLKSIFMEMFGDTENNAKKIEIKKIADICEVKTGGTPDRAKSSYWDDGTIPWVKTTEIKENTIYNVDEFITSEGLKNSNATIFPKGTILIAMYGQGITRGKVAKLGIDAATNQACAALLPSKKYNTDYLLFCLKISYNRLRELGRGGNQPNLNLSIIKSFNIILPSLELQNKFASIVNEVQQMKDQQKHSKEHLDNLFNALKQKAFKGGLTC